MLQANSKPVTPKSQRNQYSFENNDNFYGSEGEELPEEPKVNTSPLFKFKSLDETRKFLGSSLMDR
jgi:hypothetical protein